MSFTSIHPQSFLRNIPFCLARCICTIVEKENETKTVFRAKSIIKTTKIYCIALIENSIKIDLQIPLNKLRKPKEKRTEEIIPFLSAHNPNNPNIFPIMGQTFENFQHSKTMSNVFFSLMNCMHQASQNFKKILSQNS